MFVLKESFINGGRIKTPTSSEKRYFLRIACDGVLHAIRERLRGVGVIEAFEAQFLFGESWLALGPESSPGPGIGADNAASIGFDPGVMMQYAAGIEKLDAAELATDFEDKTKAGVDVVARFGQSRAEDDDPTFNWRRNEQFFVASQSFEPRAGLGVLQAEGGLNGSQIPALDGKPGGRTTDKSCGMGGSKGAAADSIMAFARDLKMKRACARAAGQQHDHRNAATQCETQDQQEQHWHDVRCDVHSGVNLRMSCNRSIGSRWGKEPFRSYTAPHVRLRVWT